MSDKPNGWTGSGCVSLIAFLLLLLGLVGSLSGGMVMITAMERESRASMTAGALFAGFGMVSIFASGLLFVLTDVALALLGTSDKSQ